MRLDFGDTCPDINKSMNQLKNDIESNLEWLAEEISPIIDRKQLDDKIDQCLCDIDFEEYFEEVRETNVQMRDAADHQLTELSQQLDDEIRENEELRSLVSALEGELGDLQSKK